MCILRKTMRIIKITGVLLLGLISAICGYLLSYIFIGGLLMHYSLNWYKYIYFVVALIIFIFIVYSFWPRKKASEVK